ncbi:MAG TPA: hypothetical protein VIU81_08155 [Gaiellaceae bacterium]
MRLVGDFNEIERGIGDDWSELRFVLTVADEKRVDRAAALLGPANPGLLGTTLRFSAMRHGQGVGPEAVRRLLKRLDDEKIIGRLELLGSTQALVEDHGPANTLRSQWENAVATLPPDWSDVYAEVRLDSTDYLERGALLLAPINPDGGGGAPTLRFRSAQHFGYGVSPQMAARCFGRCDEEGITGDVSILHALSDTRPVGTQGPVWIREGRVV